ncbi:acyl-CoA thioesterase [Ramlibacter sp.]|uniref:acyl-CoA thioesterase n=1 Tax=Ramlibacter sp. TaxID=1917967 RepID=UPI0035B46A06
MKLAPWNGTDIALLLQLQAQGPGCWRNAFGDPNKNGRAYGGQLLGQALMAGLLEAPADRPPSMMQFLFLQGALHDEPIDFTVTPLQDGKRFTSRHVRGAQAGGRMVLDAQVTCAAELASPTHEQPCAAPPGEHATDLPAMQDLPADLLQGIESLGGYSQDMKASVDFRVPDARRQILALDRQPRLRFWLRAASPLPNDPRVHAAAFAYLSDWWTNFASLALHRADLGARRLYIASLNHAIWLHRPPRVDEWLHFDCESPGSMRGRGLSIGRVHDAQGRLVASVTQECLLAYAD